ncbi:hypothetical protein SAMN04515674_12362 [Pseudarcicella hirudinis]|uniref:Outer membrane protein beta-barrel domain-containing protein n=1 Tax=Pseudarcicella hirudinis TaxID=1079859 RepID=A0A1I5Z1Z2_9BACT|nr:hypothetical protein [Pseudarcicella hirudinis]SFQ50440.1 hypothetical protein SAMN04515674_12362 [Pseudarcicella hirudinis]
MKKIFTLFLCFQGYQSLSQIPDNFPSFGVEVDPVAYILKGYSLHGIYQPFSNWSFDLGVFGIEEPEGYSGNSGFRVTHKGFGVKAHYHFNGKTTRGLYTGFSFGYSRTEAVYKQSGESAGGHGLGFGPHIGYRFFLNKPKEGIQRGLYITPWVGVDYSLPAEKIDFEKQKYQESRWTFFPTVHFGYRF